MTTYIRSNAFIKSLEFWTASSILLVAAGLRLAAYLSGDTADIPVPDISRVGRMPEDHYRLHLVLWLARNVVLYLAFLAMCFRILPGLLRGRTNRFLILEAALLIVLTGLSLGAIENGVQQQVPGATAFPFDPFLRKMLETCRLAGFFVIYYGARNVAVGLLKRVPRSDHLSGFAKLAMIAGMIGLLFSLALSELPGTIPVPVALLFFACAKAFRGSRRLRSGTQRPAAY